MSSSRFKIGQASKMLGIAPETLRYYETKHIIPFQKEENSRYRTFDVADICILGKARSYLKYGISLDDAQAMLNQDSIQYTVQRLEEQADLIKQQIQEQLALLHSIEAKLDGIKKTQDSLGRFTLANRPAMYALKVYDKTQSPSCNDEQALWLGHMNTFSFIRIHKDSFTSMQMGDYGLYKGILAQDAPSSGLSLSSDVELLPSCPCLYTTTISATTPLAFEPVLAYLAENNLQVTGDVIWKGGAVHRGNTGYQYYRELWIPIL